MIISISLDTMSATLSELRIGSTYAALWFYGSQLNAKSTLVHYIFIINCLYSRDVGIINLNYIYTIKRLIANTWYCYRNMLIITIGIALVNLLFVVQIVWYYYRFICRYNNVNVRLFDMKSQQRMNIAFNYYNTRVKVKWKSQNISNQYLWCLM